MIPKVIHYCWFGGSPIPKVNQKYIESWKKFCPDYEIVRWDETNCDINCNAYVKAAYEEKKYGFVPDFFRLKIIYENGGFYFDTDVELIKSLDSLRDYHCFFGREHGGYVAPGLGFGAEKGNQEIGDMLKLYDELSFYNPDGTLNLTPSPIYVTDMLVARGLTKDDKLETIENVTILPTSYLCPKNNLTGIINITTSSVSIHHYDASWTSPTNRFVKGATWFAYRHFGNRIGKTVNGILLIPRTIKENGFIGFLKIIFRKRG